MNNMVEEWRVIPGYENYEVSNLGQIRSLNWNRTGTIRILKQLNHSSGYLAIGLTKNGVQKRFTVHRIVAMTFIPNPNNLPEINHKDENKHNNSVENLEWVSHKYNINFGTRNKRHSEKMKNKSSWHKGIPMSQESKDKLKKSIKEWHLKRRKLGLGRFGKTPL